MGESVAIWKTTVFGLGNCGPKGDRANRRETRASRSVRDDKIPTLEGYVILGS